MQKGEHTKSQRALAWPAALLGIRQIPRFWILLSSSCLSYFLFLIIVVLFFRSSRLFSSRARLFSRFVQTFFVVFGRSFLKNEFPTSTPTPAPAPGPQCRHALRYPSYTSKVPAPQCSGQGF